MKIQNSDFKTEKFNVGDEKSFGISNIGLIFEILRNKLYSDKISSICREIAANARDAHREKGISEREIEIFFPNFVESSNFIVKDFGFGISQSRMENIFINYAESTKRESNLQTGGFGLGAKSPFAYTDTFSIKTICDGFERLYSCFIDETRIGKLVLINEEKTNKETGTEIIIPIKKTDSARFLSGVEIATRYWRIKPKFNSNFLYNEPKPILQGIDWQIESAHDYYGTERIKVVADGILYHIPKTQKYLSYENERTVEHLTKKSNSLVLFFSTGDLNFSASRENLEFDSKTIESIEQSISAIKNKVNTKILEEISKCSSYKEALTKWTFYKNNITFDFSATWNNLKLWSLDDFGGESIKFKRDAFSKELSDERPQKFRRLRLNNDELICINDLTPKPMRRHIKKICETHEKINEFYVLSLNEQQVETVKTQYHFDEIGVVYFSKELLYKKRTSTNSKTIIFLYNFQKQKFERSSQEIFVGDKNQKVYCSLNSHMEPDVGFRFVHEFQKNFKDISIYAFKKIPKTNELTYIKDFTLNYLKENGIELEELRKLDYTHTLSLELNSNNIKFDSKIKKLLKENDEIEEKKTKLCQLFFIHPIFYKNTESVQNIKDLEREYKHIIAQQYPLLCHVHYNTPTEYIENYINLVDEKNHTESLKNGNQEN